MLKIVCFKWQHKSGYKLSSSINNSYTAEHVNRLERMVRKHLSLPHEFICITDDNKGINCKTIPLWDKYSKYGGCYNRLYVFSKDMQKVIGSRFACIDLDCVILNSIDHLFCRDDDFIINQYGRFRINRKQWYNGSLFYMKAGARSRVWDEFSADRISEIDNSRYKGMYVGTDQAWISKVLGRGEAMYDEDDGVYNYSSLPDQAHPPENACIVFFAGAYDPTTQAHRLWVRRNYFDENVPQSQAEVLPLLQQRYLDAIEETKKAEWVMGYFPDLSRPQTYNEKMLWNFVYADEHIMKRLADRNLMKTYFETLATYIKTTPTLKIETDSDCDFFPDLEKPFTIRPFYQGNEHTVIGANAEVNQVNKIALTYLEKKPVNASRWRFYRGRRPYVMAEPVIDSSKYKSVYFYMSNGQCLFIQMAGKNKLSTYDENWQWLDVKANDKENPGEVKISGLARILKDLKRISKEQNFIMFALLVAERKAVLNYTSHYAALRFEGTSFDRNMGYKMKFI